MSAELFDKSWLARESVPFTVTPRLRESAVYDPAGPVQVLLLRRFKRDKSGIPTTAVMGPLLTGEEEVLLVLVLMRDAVNCCKPLA